MTTSNQIDYEKYARERPHFHGRVSYPDIYYHAVTGLTGSYADVGAGDGRRLCHALENGVLSAFNKIMAFDISAERVRRLSELMPAIEASTADAAKLPVADSSIDLYFSDQVIEHVANDVAMATEIRRVLKPGGRALIGSTIKGRGAWYFYRCNGRWVIDPTHLREYRSMKEYCSVFERAGLSIVETALEPTLYAVGELFLRIVMLTGLIEPDNLMKIYATNRFLCWVGGWRIRIPRYWLSYVIVQRR